MSAKRVYLACPYSSPSERVRESRVYLASRIASNLMTEGLCVYSPITHGHTIAEHLHKDFVENHEFWMAQCMPILEVCDALVILPLDGWRSSRGVHLEIERARQLAMPIFVYQNGFCEIIDEEEAEHMGFHYYEAKEVKNAN